MALAEAALQTVDEVLFVLPRALPHKEYTGVGFDDRMQLLLNAAAFDRRYSVGSSEGGLFIEIARECREAYGRDARIVLLCGRDAAERIVGWDYGDAGPFTKMLDDFELLVAARNGEYTAPEDLRHRVHPVELAPDCDMISATEVRERIVRGVEWRHLVPASIAARVAELYG